MLTNDICCYVDTSLMGQMDTWFFNGITGNVITLDGRFDGAVREDGSSADDEGQGQGEGSESGGESGGEQGNENP
jgi:hypothetical protein